MDCLFCKIINREIPADIIYEDDVVIVIMDAYPDVDGHLLVIPKTHYADFQHVPDDVLLHINKVAKKMVPMLMEKLHKDALTMLVNYGEDQKIKHYHLHLLPEFIHKGTKHTREEIVAILKDENHG